MADPKQLLIEMKSIMSRYDAAPPMDDENGMAAPIMLGPEYFRKIIEALHLREANPLVWDGFGLEMWSDGVAGRYYISGHGGSWSWTFDDADPYHHGVAMVSEEAAKGAADEHNAAIISSAMRRRPDDCSVPLTVITTEQTEVSAMAAALRRISKEKRPAYHDCIDDGLEQCAWCDGDDALAAYEALLKGPAHD